MTIETVHNCIGCGLCVDVCPHKAILLKEDKNGYYSPMIDRTQCVDCGLCLKKCIAENEASIVRHPLEEETVYAAWTTDDELIKKSASGGVFAQVAKDFLHQGSSVVYGATLTDDTRVKHIRIESADDLYKLQNSKYQQSDMSGIYSDVKTQLQSGKRVLFSGTPCQVAAVYAFCGKSERLYTAEILCHGVPSNYLAQLAIRLEDARRIKQYRTKSEGWERGSRTVYESKDGKIYEKHRYCDDFHIRAYQSFSLNRKSCGECPFARAERVADITMGDFWGLDKSKYNHYQGVSVLIVNSEKGEELTTSGHLYRKPTTWPEITSVNQNVYMPTNYSVFKLADKVHELKQKPLWLQKIVVQNGLSNRLLKAAYMLFYTIWSLPGRMKAKREADKCRSELLQRTEALRPKVGILTTYFAANYGAMLQPYALKRVFENEGCQVEFIRYKQPSVYAGHLPLSRRKLEGRSLSSALGVIAASPLAYIQYWRMQRFRKHYLQSDSSFSTVIPQDKQLYVFGSDQIWNPKNTNGFDDIYFGSFRVPAGAKKIAYAASGERIAFTPDECEYLRTHLPNFDAISVREKSLKQQLEQHVDTKGLPAIDVVFDPTLLATKDILDELPARHPLKGKPFVFCYVIRDCLAFLPKIHEFARARKLPFVILTSTPKKEALLFAAKHRDVHYFSTAGMDLFLGCERYAEYVFTPSFHGSVFALINHKPLFSLLLNDGLDTRVVDLLCSVKQEGRLVTLDANWDACPEMDYNTVEQLLVRQRKHSLDFIRNNAKGILHT